MAVPMVAVGSAEVVRGAALKSYGAAVTTQVVLNQLNFEGKGKGGGKNAAHANQKARQAAQKNYEEAKRKLEDFKKTSRGQKGFKDKVDKLRKWRDHCKRKMDFTGENHSNNAKGN